MNNHPICPFSAPRHYDPQRAGDQDWLLWWADLYRVPFSELDRLSVAMKGKGPPDFPRVWDEHVRRRPTLNGLAAPTATRSPATPPRGLPSARAALQAPQRPPRSPLVR